MNSPLLADRIGEILEKRVSNILAPVFQTMRPVMKISANTVIHQKDSELQVGWNRIEAVLARDAYEGFQVSHRTFAHLINLAQHFAECEPLKHTKNRTTLSCSRGLLRDVQGPPPTMLERHHLRQEWFQAPGPFGSCLQSPFCKGHYWETFAWELFQPTGIVGKVFEDINTRNTRVRWRLDGKHRFWACTPVW